MTKFIKILSAIIFCALLQQNASAQTFEHDDTVSVYTMYGTIYADMFVGRRTANGEIYTQDKFTAAHWKLKFGTLVRVTNINTGQQIIVRINDRCPKRGVLDLTRRAANSIGIKGCQKVNVQVLPERYYSEWERQNPESGSPKNNVTKPTVKAKQQSADTQKQNFQKPKKKASTPSAKHTQPKASTSKGKYPDLYKIQVCVADNRLQANKAVSKLPYYYQNKINFVPENNKIAVVINTPMQHPQATTVLSKIKHLFPKCKLIKVIKN